MMNALRSHFGPSVTLAVMATVLLAAAPYALADGHVVIFSQDTGSLSSVSYTIDVTGTFSHLVMDLEEGVYDVQQDGVSLGTYNCYEGDNWVEFTSTGDGTFTFALALAGAPDAPVITTDGGNGPGVDYTTTEPSLLLEGTCDSAIETIEVNGSTSGVSYTAGATAWSYTDTLSAGANVFQVTATAGGLTSLPDTITITLPGAEPPPAPVITTNGGSDYTITEPSLLLEGTCDGSTEIIEVNGSASGVSYAAGDTTWSYSGTLSAGANVFQVTATANGLTSSADTISITLAGVELPPAPVITTNGGSDYTTTEPGLLLEGTCDGSTEIIEVNASTSGVSYTAGDTAWSYSDTLSEGANVFQVTATADGLTSPADSITVTLDVTPPSAPVITTDGGNGPGIDYTTDNPSFALAGTCDSSTDAIRVNGSSSNVAYVPGGTSWSYGEGLEEQVPTVATAFQNEGTLEVDVLAGVSSLDGVWSPGDVIPVGTVIHDRYACDLWTNALDAVSLEFDAGTMDLSNLALRVYLQKATSGFTHWEHYELLPGTMNPQDEDLLVEADDGRDHLPGGQLANNTTVGWVELPFDATSDPLFIEPNGNIGVTLRLWNWRVDAVALVQLSGGTVSLSEGANTFSVTAVDAIGNESAADSITVTLATAALTAPVITTDGGSGAGADFTTAEPNVPLDGTCAAETAVIKVNGSTVGVSYTTGQTAWSYATTLAEGANTFSVTAEDAGGGSSSADTITITLDTTPPAVAAITTDGGSGPGENYLTNVPAVTLEGTCDTSTASILVNGSGAGVTYTAGATTWTYAGTLAEGENTFAVAAQDSLGNTSAADSIAVTLDTQAPSSIRPDIQP